MDISSENGWVAALGGKFLQRAWQPKAGREGVNWKGMWAAERAPNEWIDIVRDKSALVRVANSTRAAYERFGVGRSSEVTAAARGTREAEATTPHTLLALHIAGECDAVAEASSQFALQASARGPRPT